MTIFCDRDNNIKKKRNIGLFRNYNPTNGQNRTSSGNSLGHSLILVISVLLSSLFCSLVFKINNVTVLCSLGR